MPDCPGPEVRGPTSGRLVAGGPGSVLVPADDHRPDLLQPRLDRRWRSVSAASSSSMTAREPATSKADVRSTSAIS